MPQFGLKWFSPQSSVVLLMDNGLLIKVLVVGLALLFLLEPFAMTVSNWAGVRTTADTSQHTGTATVNITI